MDGMTLLEEARAAGLTVTTDGDRLRIRGPRSAEPIAQKILRHKADVLAALSPITALDVLPLDVDPLPADLPPEWFERFEERVAIMVHDGGLHPEHAEAAALQSILDAMRRAGVPIPKWKNDDDFPGSMLDETSHSP